MARTFDQVLAEVTSRSDPQRNIVLNQISQLPGQQKADEASLDAKKNQAFDDIVSGARQRGLGFSGIPLGEQAEYSATEYAPALANLKSNYSSRRGSLESALADIGRTDYTTAQDIFARDREFAEQQRQFEENLRLQREQIAAQQRAAAASTFSPTLGATGNQSSQSQKQYVGSDDFRGRLAYLAQQGDSDAQVGLRYAGNDGRFDGAVKSLNELAALQRLGITGNYYLPGLNTSTGGFNKNIGNIRFG